MAESYEHLKRADEGALTTVSLARPDSRNALNAALIAELTRCFEELTQADEVRVVILTGDGGSFCAGADVGYMRDSANFSYEENLEDARRLAAMFGAVEGCPKPVVAEVRGAAIGGGIGLVAAADLAIAEEETVFAFSEVRLGIAPATIAPFVLRKIGHSHARALFLTGERFGAQRAREIGLVHQVASGGDLGVTVERTVSQLLQGGPRALAAAKGLLRELEVSAPEEATERMARRISDLRTGEEGQEGLGAFLEKREPGWRGE
jgi:methylglutaconyl-CoA hydratase